MPAPAPATTTVSPAAAPAPRRKSTDPNLLIGVAASPGLAVGEVFQVRRMEIAVTEAGAGVEAERRQLAAALATAQGQLAALRAKLHAKAEPAKAAIFAAHEELLSDPDLLEIAESAIAKGKSAAFAWKKAFTTHADRLAGLRNQLLAQRANDLRDVGLRVLSLLTGAETKPAGVSAEHCPHRRRSHALGHRDARPLARDGLLHDARRRDLPRGNSRALAGHSRAGRHRAGRARSAERHAS